MVRAETYLKRIRYDQKHAGAFTGPEKLYQIIKKEGKVTISRNKIKQWLQDQDSYGLQRSSRKVHKRRKVIVPYIDYQWDVDLADVSNIAVENENYKYLLMVIDIFSRFLWVIPLKGKTANNVITGLKKIL